MQSHSFCLLRASQFGLQWLFLTAHCVTLLRSTVGGSLSVTLQNVTATSYNISVWGATGSGAVRVSIPAAVCHTDAGAPNQASSAVDDLVTLDTSPPSVRSLAPAAGQAALTKTSPVVFNLTCSEPCVGVSPALFRCGTTLHAWHHLRFPLQHCGQHGDDGHDHGDSPRERSVPRQRRGLHIRSATESACTRCFRAHPLLHSLAHTGTVLLSVAAPGGVSDLAGNALANFGGTTSVTMGAHLRFDFAGHVPAC